MKLSTYLRCAADVLTSIALIGLASAAPLAQGPSDPAERGLQLLGNEPSYLDFGVDVFNNQGHNHSPATPEGWVEFRYGEKLLYISGPLLVCWSTPEAACSAMRGSTPTSSGVAS